MKLYFIRHGQSVGNLTGDYSTPFHGVLSNNGETQANGLIQRLKGYKFDHIIVSPIKRAAYTILPYLKENNLIAELWSEVAEACYQNDIDGETSENIRYGNPIHFDEKDMKYFYFRYNDKHKALPPEDENYKEGLKRITWVYESVLHNYKGTDQSILVVGHYHAGSRLLEMFLGMEPLGRICHSNTGFSMLEELPSGDFQIRFINRLS